MKQNQYHLTINQYFSLVKEKIINKDFKILKINSLPEKEISVYLEAINYFQYEWSDDHKDPRQPFDYIIIPNNTDWDFTSISFKEFMLFLSKNKSTKILNINTDNIEIIDNIIIEKEDNEIDEFWNT